VRGGVGEGGINMKHHTNRKSRALFPFGRGWGGGLQVNKNIDRICYMTRKTIVIVSYSAIVNRNIYIEQLHIYNFNISILGPS